MDVMFRNGQVMLKDAPGALADFDAAQSLSPCSAHIYFNRGNLYTSLLLYDKAEIDYCKGEGTAVIIHTTVFKNYSNCLTNSDN